MVFYPENHDGEKMKDLDILTFGVPLLTGLFLLCRFFHGTSMPARIRRVPKKISLAHRRAHAKLVTGKTLSRSGGMLVTSLRGWILAELVGMSATVVSLAIDPSLSGIPVSLLLGLSLGGVTLFSSFREQAKRQVESIRSSLPVATFLFSLLLDAGTGSHAALQQVARAIPEGPLARELEEISRARNLGITGEDALERSRRRVPLEDYHIFLNLVRQGERLGTGLSRALREHSSKMLDGERHRAEAFAQKASVKLLFPLVTFIFPSVVLIIFSPIILDVLEMWR